MRLCAFVGCGNGDYQLRRWQKDVCDLHNCNKGVAHCVCPPPFELFPFPSDELMRREWVRLVNRKDASGKNWEPVHHSRVCSRHFVDGRPTDASPYPTLELGYTAGVKRARPPPKRRLASPQKRPRKQVASSTTTVQAGPSTVVDAEELQQFTDPIHLQNTASPTTNDTLSDHSYCSRAGSSVAIDQDSVIKRLQHRIRNLERTVCKQSGQLYVHSQSDICEQFVSTDSLVKMNTGLPTHESFATLYSYLEPDAAKMNYWVGTKRTPHWSPRRWSCHRTRKLPKKRGVKRQLSVKSELVLVLMKLKLAVQNTFLASIFNISAGSCSSIINTWIRFLAKKLKPLVYWPDKQIIQTLLPKSVASKYPKLRCTIDCSETFIDRPRDLLLQASTWSDYKHHNTLKYLVAIAPNGHISFISNSWGGRATDRYIVQQSGFLDLIDPGDTVLADRGFTIQDDLLFRQASLVIPPPGSGKTQMTRANVLKTRQIANVRIHVERAINRLKWFRILSSTLPVTLVPVFDDILLICSALCNLLPRLVN